MVQRQPRTRITREGVIATAVSIADEGGLDAVSLSAVATRLGCSPPSLYTHVDSLADLLDGVTTACTAEFADALRDSVVGRAGDDALRAFSESWRSFAASRPARYAAVFRRAASPDAARAQAVEVGMRAGQAVLRSLGVAERDLAVAATTLRAYLQGFVDIERIEAPVHADAAFVRGIDALVAGFRRDVVAPRG
jgi:AcrR family transcriptional regulator